MVSFTRKDCYRIEDLMEILRLLRGEGGCPWDREQTHQSIRMEFIEETYEAVEAIDTNDIPLMREELGDVLLQVAFHCQIEREQGSFTFDDVCDEVCKKLIERHPHVFGELNLSDTEAVLKNWDKIKQEKKQQSNTDTLTAVSKALPALMRAQKVGKRAMRAGMDFDNAQDAFACVSQETAELQEAMQSGTQEQVEEELGDLLFSCVNTARHLHVDAEEALTRATEKFIRRFQKTEELLKQEGIEMHSLGIDALDIYWRRAKEAIR